MEPFGTGFTGCDAPWILKLLRALAGAGLGKHGEQTGCCGERSLGGSHSALLSPQKGSRPPGCQQTGSSGFCWWQYPPLAAHTQGAQHGRPPAGPFSHSYPPGASLPLFVTSLGKMSHGHFACPQRGRCHMSGSNARPPRRAGPSARPALAWLRAGALRASRRAGFGDGGGRAPTPRAWVPFVPQRQSITRKTALFPGVLSPPVPPAAILKPGFPARVPGPCSCGAASWQGMFPGLLPTVISSSAPWGRLSSGCGTCVWV